MNFNNYLKNLRQSGFHTFTLQQLMHDLCLSKGAARNAVFRKKQSGDLISPAKGFYVMVPPEYQPYGSIPAEELVPLIMQHLQLDYYVGLLSAAAFCGATHQKTKRFQIVTNKRIAHPMRFGQVKIEVVYKHKLLHLPIENRVVATGYLPVAKPELVAFDLLHYPVRCGGINHIATVLSELLPLFSETSCPDNATQAEKEMAKSNFGAYLSLLNFAKTTGDSAWIQRLGFILEKLDDSHHVEQSKVVRLFQAYLHQKPLRFVPLVPHLPHKKCRRHKLWGIVENTTIKSDL